MDLSSLNINDLKNLQRQIADTIVSRKDRLKDEVKNKIRALAADHGLTLEELFGSRAGTPAKSKLAAKYRNPNPPHQTWSGRGRVPQWMRDPISQGAKKEDFLIK